MIRKPTDPSKLMLFFILAGIVLFLKGVGVCESEIDIYKKRADTINREIEKGKEEVEAYNRKETDVIKRLHEVELALNHSRKRAAALKAEIEELEKQITATSKISAELQRQVQANEAYVAKRLIAVYKMNWLGTFHLLASAESIQEFIRRKAALERILGHDEKIRRDLVQNQTDLTQMLERLRSHKIEKNARAAEYKEQIDIMSQERSTRNRLLEEIRSQKALELAAIDALTQSAGELDQKIKLLSTTIDSGAADKNAAELLFSDQKGLLIMPVNGKIVSLFGPYKHPQYHVTNFRSGIDIQVDKGEPVQAVFRGKVLYSDWFKGYGNMMIIDHGDNYYTIYAHLEETFKSKGDGVDAGEVIATAGDSGSMTGSKLYFEVRHRGTPLDPLKWLKTG
jgi:septal ring factor EnvC (AmiA/AmiB activator)